MALERPELDGKSPAERAKLLYQEALETLDLALSAHGAERALLLDAALELRRSARAFEAADTIEAPRS